MERIERVSEPEVTWAKRINLVCKGLTSFSTGAVTLFLIIYWVWLYYQ